MNARHDFDEADIDALVSDALSDLGEPLDYAVIGPRDDRFQIRAQRRRPSTLLFPFNTICLLQINTGSGTAHGTGTLIAPQVVLTAKHCLMNVRPPCASSRAVGTWFPSIRVTPGADFSAASERNRRPATPASIDATSARFRADPDLDYGVIVLPRAVARPSEFMMLQPRGRSETATLLTIAGYPCDKSRGTMWGHSKRIPLTGVTPTHLFYSIDTCPGHSGSPIWLLGNAGIRLLLGVHTAGPPGCDNDPAPGRQCRPTGAAVTPVSGDNCGVRVTCHVINSIIRWCREFGVRGPRLDQRVYRQQCPQA